MTVKEMAMKREAKTKRMKEIVEGAEVENRRLSAEETAEFDKLEREVRKLDAEYMAGNSPVQSRKMSYGEADEVLRRAKAEKHDVTIRLQRDIMQTPGLDDTGIIDIEEKEMMDPLVSGLIWDKMGIPVESGLAGTLRWPIHGDTTASWEDEVSELKDSSIDFSALKMNGRRLGCAVPVSRTELADSKGVVERVVRKEMPMACQRRINTSVLTLVKQEYDSENSRLVDKKVYGPYAMTVNDNALVSPVTMHTLAVDGQGELKGVRKTLLQMIAGVYGTGVQKSNPGFAMSENMKVLLQDTKVDAGSGRFLCEGENVLGYPVYTSNDIPDGVIMFGDWSYQAAGFFGETSLIVDPYTLARKYSTDFVLNMRFGTVTLRKEAFAIAMTADAQSALVAKIKALVPANV